MYISSLTLQSFRNYDKERIEFSPHTNVIFGDNAQGKTNILEAIYMFAQGKSHRARTDKELIAFGKHFAKIGIEFHDADRDYSGLMQLSRGGKKSIKINHVQIKKLSMLMNYLNVVMFSPEDLDLVKGSPTNRRRFVDAAVSQLNPPYLVSLIDYHKALAQKNSLLKELRRKGRQSDVTLSVWNEQLAEAGVKIMKYRREFLESLNGFASDIQKEISGEELKISYAPNIHGEVTADEFYDLLEANQKREIELTSAVIGVQRDDMAISVNGREARIYGSQGQQRTAALSAKIAQADYIESKKDEYPVLLLDDIMSELDVRRRLYLAEKIRGKQVFITCTDTDLIDSTDETRLFHVKGGKTECI